MPEFPSVADVVTDAEARLVIDDGDESLAVRDLRVLGAAEPHEEVLIAFTEPVAFHRDLD